MAEKTISTRQKQKYDTSTNWATNNIVLLAGEIGIESDTNKFKVGNGTSTWNELDYTGGSKIPLYSTTGQNTDGAMTQKAVTDALPQAVTVTLTESQNFNDISLTNEQFDLLLSNPENYLIIETSNGSLTISLKYRRSQYFTMTSGNILQEALIFNCVNPTSFAPYAERIDSMTLIRQTQNGETNIAVQDDTLDFTTFVPKTRTINGKSLSNDITLTATDVNALPDTTEIPSTLADLTDDSTHRTVTDTEKSTWNAKSDFSGSYNDLTDKPTIPTININGASQSTINFDSDPQTQIDNLNNNKFDKTGGTVNGNVTINGSLNGSVVKFGDAELDGTNQGGSMELGSLSQVSTPFIDFHTDGNPNTDFNVRLLASGSELQITAADGISINGVPIIKSGSNTNGYYTKLEDGTLICRYKFTDTLNNGHTVTFPHPFISTEDLSITTQQARDSGISAQWINGQAINKVSKTGFNVYAGYSESSTIYWKAIGRWK